MAHSGPTVRPADGPGPAALGRALIRLGAVVVAVTIPPVVGAGTGIAVTADTPAQAAAIMLRAMNGPLVGARGLPWLFHLATLALLCGCWLLGAGLVLDGLFDYSSH